MARIRKFNSYRRLERPNTRVSKFSAKSYVKARPAKHIVKFDLGEPQRKFQYTFYLVPKASLQIRDNALESARQTSNRLLESKIGKSGYHMKVRVYPHHILRENPLAAGAGADRMSTGMQRSYGKAIGNAARVMKGQKIMSISVDKQHLEAAKQAINRAKFKIPCSCYIQMETNT